MVTSWGGDESTSKGEDCKANCGIADRHGMSATAHREPQYVVVDVCLADVVESAMCGLTAIEDTSSSTASFTMMHLDGRCQTGRKLQDANSSTVRVPEHGRPHQQSGYASCPVHTAFVASTMDCWAIAVLKDDGRAVIQETTEPCDHTLWV